MALQYRRKIRKGLKKIEKFWRLLLNAWSLVGDTGLVEGATETTIQLVASTMVTLRNCYTLGDNSGDNTLKKHLDAGKRNAMHTSKTTQNDLLEYIKKFSKEKFTKRLLESRTDHFLEL